MAGYFSDDLNECRAKKDFSGLIEDLEFMRDELKVGISELVTRVDEKREEHSDNEERYADAMHDQWKKGMYEERANDRSMSGMFGTLKGDRD